MNAVKISSTQIGCNVEITSGANEWYRLCVKCNKELVEVNNEKLDKHLRTEMQTLNVMILVVVNNELRYTVYSPSFMAGEVWDVGFLNAFNGEMMLINVMQATLPANRLELCNDYFSFFGLLTKKANLRSVLGFQKDGKTKFEDTIMDSTMFKKILSNLMKIEEASNSFFLESVANALSDIFGKVSYLALIKLVNMNLASFCEMEYSRTVASPSKEPIAKKIDFGFLYSSPPIKANFARANSNEVQIANAESKIVAKGLPKISEEIRAEKSNAQESFKPIDEKKEMNGDIKKALDFKNTEDNTIRADGDQHKIESASPEVNEKKDRMEITKKSSQPTKNEEETRKIEEPDNNGSPESNNEEGEGAEQFELQQEEEHKFEAPNNEESQGKFPEGGEPEKEPNSGEGKDLIGQDFGESNN